MREMKDSGVPWIGEIPNNWIIAKMKHISSSMKSGGTPSSENPIFYCDDGTSWVAIGDMRHGGFICETQKHLTKEGLEDKSLDVFPAGTLLYSIYASVGKVSVLQIPAAINQAILAISVNKEMKQAYCKFLLMSMGDYVYSFANGNTQFNLNAGIVSNLPIVLPPLYEQIQIANFLDAKCVEIDSILEKTRTSIEEYKKLKQSVITEAVTKGIHGERPMRDSGVEWIGEIPEGWRCCKLKQACSKISDGSHFSPEISTEGYPYITAKDVHGLGIDYTSASKISEENYFALVKAGCKPERNDVLLVKDGATTGRVGMVTDNTACVLLSSVAMLHHNSQVSPTYLYYFLQSNVMQEQIVISMAGSAMPRITLSKIVGFVLTIPPISEQKEIAAYLDEKCAAIDSLIASKEALITELEAYKKSLIYEYVTGKKEV